jgi:hypothetical protein
MNWILARLKEPSTYLGAFAVASAFFNINLTPEQQEAIMQLSIALVGGGLIVSKG